MTDGPEQPEIDFEQCVEDALASLPHELSAFMSNVAVVVEDEPPGGRPLLRSVPGRPADPGAAAATAACCPTRSASTEGHSSGTTGGQRMSSAWRSGGSSCTRSPTISASATIVCASSTATDAVRRYRRVTESLSSGGCATMGS